VEKPAPPRPPGHRIYIRKMLEALACPPEIPPGITRGRAVEALRRAALELGLMTHLAMLTEENGVITVEPPRVGSASYGVLVPQVDADGNDLGGIRSVFVQAPTGTYTGWSVGRAGAFEGGMCNLQGSFVPFAPDRAAREATGDPRPSLTERYSDQTAYVAAFQAAAERDGLGAVPWASIASAPPTK